MFKYIFLFASFLKVYSAKNGLRETRETQLEERDEWKQFANFQERFSKRYETIHELENRFEIFRSNLRYIISHNLENNKNFTMGINQFTDLTPEEFKETYVSGYKPLQSFGCGSFSSHGSNVPSTIDWTTKGVVNSVRDNAVRVGPLLRPPMLKVFGQFLVAIF